MIDKNLTDEWKKKMIDSLYYLYKDKGVSIDKIKTFVNEEMQTNYKSAIGKWRNIYKFDRGENDINNIVDEIRNDNSIIAANGSLIYNYDNEPSPIYDLLVIRLAERKKFKELMLKAVVEGNKIEERNYDRLQYKKKEFANSTYGNMTMSSGFLSNCDSASAITLQARQISSEMLWNVERFLAGNASFYNSNELLLYFNKIMSDEWIDKSLLNIINYIPTIEDCKNKFEDSLYEMNGLSDFKESDLYKALLNKIEFFSEEERIKYYYKDNIFGLVARNHYFKELYSRILSNPEEFLDPYNIPESYKNDLDNLWKIMDNFVFSKMLTYKRVEKYITRTRKAVLMSDTDSIMICLDEYFTLIGEILDNRFEYKVNLSNRYKLVNSTAYLLSNVCDYMCNKLATDCNIDPKERHRLKMKNEFFFMRMVLFAGVKKNYVTLTTLQEGKVVNEKNTLKNTGGKLTSSNLIPEIRDRMNHIIKTKILEPIEVSPVDIWVEVKNLQKFIYDEIAKGNKKYTLFGKYKGMIESYKNPERIELIRAVVIWNRLYPEYHIDEGSTVYKIKTKVKTLDDVETYISDPEWKEKVYDLVFDKYGKHRREFANQDFSKYGLSALAINALDNQPSKIPEWIIPLIDVDYIVEMHIKPLMDLLSSVGLHQTKINSTRRKLNTLVNF